MYLIKYVEHRYDMAGSEMQLYKVLIGRFIAGVVFYRVAVKKNTPYSLMNHIR